MIEVTDRAELWNCKREDKRRTRRGISTEGEKEGEEAVRRRVKERNEGT